MSDQSDNRTSQSDKVQYVTAEEEYILSVWQEQRPRDVAAMRKAGTLDQTMHNLAQSYTSQLLKWEGNGLAPELAQEFLQADRGIFPPSEEEVPDLETGEVAEEYDPDPVDTAEIKAAQRTTDRLLATKGWDRLCQRIADEVEKESKKTPLRPASPNPHVPPA